MSDDISEERYKVINEILSSIDKLYAEKPTLPTSDDLLSLLDMMAANELSSTELVVLKDRLYQKRLNRYVSTYRHRRSPPSSYGKAKDNARMVAHPDTFNVLTVLNVCTPASILSVAKPLIQGLVDSYGMSHKAARSYVLHFSDVGPATARQAPAQSKTKTRNREMIRGLTMLALRKQGLTNEQIRNHIYSDYLYDAFLDLATISKTIKKNKPKRDLFAEAIEIFQRETASGNLHTEDVVLAILGHKALFDIAFIKEPHPHFTLYKL